MKINENTTKFKKLVDMIIFYNHRQHHDMMASEHVKHYGGIVGYAAMRLKLTYPKATEDQSQAVAKRILNERVVCECGDCKKQF